MPIFAADRASGPGCRARALRRGEVVHYLPSRTRFKTYSPSALIQTPTPGGFPRTFDGSGHSPSRPSITIFRPGPSMATPAGREPKGYLTSPEGTHHYTSPFSQTDFTKPEEDHGPGSGDHGDDDQSSLCRFRTLRRTLKNTLKPIRAFPRHPTTESETINKDLLAFIKGDATPAVCHWPEFPEYCMKERHMIRKKPAKTELRARRRSKLGLYPREPERPPPRPTPAPAPLRDPDLHTHLYTSFEPLSSNQNLLCV